MLELDFGLIFTAINLIFWYMIVKFFLLKPINKVINQRNDLINSKFNEAEAAKRDAYALKAKYDDSLKGAFEEKDRILSDARELAKVEYDKILDEAESKAEFLLSSAKEQAKEEHKRILRESDAEMAKLVMEATAKVMVANSSDENNKQIYDEFLTKEGESNHE